MADTVQKLRALTKLPLDVQGSQARDYSVAYYFKDVRLADVLDALAAVRDFTWTEQPSGRIVLAEPYNARIWEVWPNNFTPEQREVEGMGKQFLLLYEQLPKPLQTLLCDVKQGGVSFYDLPAPMQENIRAIIEHSEIGRDRARAADPRFMADARFKDYFKLKSLRRKYPGYGPETKIVFYKQYEEPRTEGIPGYAVSVTGKEGTAGAAGFFDYTENVITLASPPILLDHTTEDLASRQIAAAKDTRLRRKYTFEVRRATISEALLKLSALTHINFAAEFWNWHWEMQSDDQERSFLLQDATLKDILDRFAAEYHHSWAWLPSGVYVWHPAFKPYPRH